MKTYPSYVEHIMSFRDVLLKNGKDDFFRDRIHLRSEDTVKSSCRRNITYVTFF